MCYNKDTKKEGKKFMINQRTLATAMYLSKQFDKEFTNKEWEDIRPYGMVHLEALKKYPKFFTKVREESFEMNVEPYDDDYLLDKDNNIVMSPDEYLRLPRKARSELTSQVDQGILRWGIKKCDTINARRFYYSISKDNLIEYIKTTYTKELKDECEKIDEKINQLQRKKQDLEEFEQIAMEFAEN